MFTEHFRGNAWHNVRSCSQRLTNRRWISDGGIRGVESASMTSIEIDVTVKQSSSFERAGISEEGCVTNMASRMLKVDEARSDSSPLCKALANGCDADARCAKITAGSSWPRNISGACTPIERGYLTSLQS